MTRQDSKLVIAGLASFFAAPTALGHVPYLESQDFSWQEPFRVRQTIEQSIAVYSWLEVVDGQTDDLDVYQFSIDEPTRVFVESLVPVCPSYAEFLPWFAIVGPGLPDPAYELPIDLPEGHGAVVVPNYELGEDRPQFYEPFGGKSYYDGPDFNQTLRPRAPTMLSIGIRQVMVETTWPCLGIARSGDCATSFVRCSIRSRFAWGPSCMSIAPSKYESGCSQSDEPQETASGIDRLDNCIAQFLTAWADLIQNQWIWPSAG